MNLVVLVFLLAIVMIFVVVWEKKRLIRAQANLNKLHEDFSAKLVHELRAPLTVIRNASDMFLKNPALVEKTEGKEILVTVRHSSEEMLTLVNDLLDVYKIEAGKFQIIKVPGNLAEIIHDRIIFFGQTAKSKSIDLKFDSLDQEIVADFDRERMSQVLNNLISNAIKFSPAGGVITVSAVRVNSPEEIKWRFTKPNIGLSCPSILVSVSDTGIGVSADKIPELFSKYKQLHHIDGLDGSGLGLTIAKGIIESHGGQIFIESKVNEGTTVYFTLPLDN